MVLIIDIYVIWILPSYCLNKGFPGTDVVTTGGVGRPLSSHSCLQLCLRNWLDVPLSLLRVEVGVLSSWSPELWLSMHTDIPSTHEAETRSWAWSQQELHELNLSFLSLAHAHCASVLFLLILCSLQRWAIWGTVRATDDHLHCSEHHRLLHVFKTNCAWRGKFGFPMLSGCRPLS